MIKYGVEIQPSIRVKKTLSDVLPLRIWMILKKQCLAKHKYICNGCHKPFKYELLECHEVWHLYPDKIYLEKLEPLCKPCHIVRHLYFHRKGKNRQIALDHLAKVFLLDQSQISELLKFANDEYNNAPKLDGMRIEIDVLLTESNHHNFIKAIKEAVLMLNSSPLRGA